MESILNDNTEDMKEDKILRPGDTVRYSGLEGPWLEHQLIDGEEGVVIGRGYDPDTVCVRFGACEDFYPDELEKVEPEKEADRRTAFLTELQALLRKYDARIYDHDDYKLYVEIDHHRDKNVGFDNLFRIEYSDTNGELNADNVMDFDKE